MEKKVEYVELIYDLIFVYLIGRNNSLLHSVVDGFVPGTVFLTYLLCTLIAIQIWNFTTLYINRYGNNGVQEHVALFVNMYLLYYMAEGTRSDWQAYYYRYNVAWLLILLNLALQYYLKYRRWEKERPWELEDLRWNIEQLLILAAIVLISLPVYAVTGVPLSPLAMVAGIVGTAFNSKRIGLLVPIDFSHLTERVMLYVVFTFGEMVIAAATYFSEGVSLNGIYFSTMVFLIVVGLFVSYEYMYDHILDRELSTNGIGFMTIHIFLIVALNNITTALEFMREPEVEQGKKTVFLVASFLIYDLFLFLTNLYAKEEQKAERLLYLQLVVFAAAFAAGMALTYRNSYVSIVITVVFVYAVLLLQVAARKRNKIKNS